MSWISGIHLLVMPINVFALVIGSLIGLFLGTLPGLGPAFALTIFVPLTFDLPATTALTFLVAMYTAAVYGGAITAILVNVPGHPGNIATTFDGQPMAQQGRAAEAIASVGVAGTIGGLVAVTLVVFVSPLITNIALTFSPADYFMLAIFGMTLVAATAGEKMLWGLVLGGVGFLLSTVGQDPLTGGYRFTFGSAYLAAHGINFSLMVVGLFAIGSALLMIEEKTQIQASQPQEIHGKFLIGIKSVFRHPVEVLRGSLVGVLLGVIPGLGTPVANIAAYLVESKVKPGAGWGTGNVVGVMAPEAADNATLIAELIPTFTLGIPTAPTSALMLAAITVHGLEPGPRFFDGSGTIAELFVAMFVSQIVFAILGIFLAPLLAKGAEVPRTLLAPLIMVAGCVGAFSVNGQFGDIVVALIFGMIGFVIMKLKLPLAPLIMGAILGPLAENNFRTAIMISQTTGKSIFMAPLPIALGVLICGLVGFIVYEQRKQIVNARKAARVVSQQAGTL